MAGLEGLLTGHTLVKRYTIEQVIGRGGFAVVYQALDKRLNRPVAVKVITLTAVDEGLREQMRERLQKEARAAASLPHHPNLVTVHDVGTDPQLGLDFLVMEMLWGQNLSQYFTHHGRPNLHDGLRILRDAAEGLAIGHRAGLIHRDVKPANIFLAEPASDDEPTRVCLLDYGIAQAVEDDATVTRGANTPLSPAYASPEQLAGARDLTAATDVFSLGVVGYQLLTNERPFATKAGEAPTSWTVRRPIRAFNSRVPAAVEAVLMRAMSESPADRYPDAAAFAEALDAAQRPDDVTAVAPAPAIVAPVAASAPPVDIQPVAAPPADDVTALAPAPPPIREEAPRRPVPAAVSSPRAMPPLRPAAPARKGGSGLIIGIVLALLVGAGAMWAMFGRGDGDEQQAADRPARDTAAVTQPADPSPTDVTGTMTVDSAAVDVPPVSTGEPSATETEPGIATGVNPTFPAVEPSPSAPRPSAPVSRPAPSQPAATRPQPATPAQPQPRPTTPAPRPTTPTQPRPRPTTPVEREPEPTPPPAQPQPEPPEPQPPVPQPSPPVYTPIPAPTPRTEPVDTIFFPSTPPNGTRGR
ncbi:serine/threonine-protein kinase [Longimicrobium terrae]|uniref:Serine/threonine protein kinase n=1 Tax=Longimicrobium terrae TaxID=1639882 RepID=A0A841GXL6_9BACT|nr:serine/threonine-protein kinase [Longimicrobium terrae]MBB4636092.1 serine/threonine-protein kinase [Longimicrobium terrae]MBB6070487.1 serine/threonine protein kinase [Longimicrobium terrae]NNC29478.1 protein kinase [Longimicrobium terrae]